MIKKAETEVCVTVFFDENLSETDIKKLGDDISKREEVSRVEYVSAEQAWENFKGIISRIIQSLHMDFRMITL